MRQLIENGANPNISDREGQTPLHVALEGLQDDAVEDHKGYWHQVVEYLIRHGADPNVCDRAGVSPLHLVAEIGDVVVGEILLLNGARVEMRDNQGESPLFYALRGEHVEMVQLLVDFQGDLNSKNDDGETVEDYCISVGDLEMLQLVLSLKDPMEGVVLGVFEKGNERGNHGSLKIDGTSSFPVSFSSGSVGVPEIGQAFA